MSGVERRSLLNTYRDMYERYLRVAKGLAEECKKDKYSFDYRKAIVLCDNFKHELLGILHFLEELKVTSPEKTDSEWEKIIAEFSTIRLFHAYIDDGEVLCFWERDD